MPNLRQTPYHATVANRSSSTTQGWWTKQVCTECGLPVKTTMKHGHYTYHPDTGAVTARHTVGICTPHTYGANRPKVS